MNGAIREKFLDAETGEVRVDALAKSYRALERKLSEVTSGRGAGSDGGGRDGPSPANLANLDRDGDGVPDGPDG